MHEGDMASGNGRGDESARYRGPHGSALNIGWQGYADGATCNRQVPNLDPFCVDHPILPDWGFSAVPSRVPQPEANGLKPTSGTNCLRR